MTRCSAAVVVVERGCGSVQRPPPHVSPTGNFNVGKMEFSDESVLRIFFFFK